MKSNIILFPLAAVLFSGLAYLFPQYLLHLQPAIIPLLGVIMFGMGATLAVADFKRVMLQPGAILTGVMLQFLLMPLLAWLLAHGLGLSLPLTAGLILVGACPGGTASNVICYLARGNVALSITMTTLSTFLAVFLTPVLTWFYLGESIAVPVLAMMFSIFKIIIIPVSLGVLFNHYLGRKFSDVKRGLPLLSMGAIVLIIGIIIALNHEKIASIVPAVLLAVILHNLAGLFFGYTLAQMCGFDKPTCRAIAIEVGMQNSGLGVALASKYFAPLAALPGALFSIWHNISGAFLASYWSKQKN